MAKAQSWVRIHQVILPKIKKTEPVQVINQINDLYITFYDISF